MAAQYGAMVLVGKYRTYYKDLYFNDTAGAKVRIDSGQGAGTASAEDITFPEPVILSDIILAAATAQTKTQILVEEVPTGDIIRNSIHLASVVTRPGLGIPIMAGRRLAMVQLA